MEFTSQTMAFDIYKLQGLAEVAAEQLHEDLQKDPAFAGYDGDEDALENLTEELYSIAIGEVSDEPTIEEIIERFYVINEEIATGERDARWYE